MAPPDADEKMYRAANVAPLETLLDAARRHRVRRVVLASSTSVWRDSPPGSPARFLDETSEADGDDGYARSKIECERLLARSGIEGVTLRLARFARAGDPADEVRKLFRAVDPRDAASAFIRAVDIPSASSLYAISAPTPFRPEDAALLGRDPRAVVRARTGSDPAWVPPRVGSVVSSSRAERELGWACAYPSTLLS